MKRKTIIHGMPGANRIFQTIPGDSHGRVLVSPNHPQAMILRMKLKHLLNKIFKKKTIIHGMPGKNRIFQTTQGNNHGRVLASPNHLQVMILRMKHKLLLNKIFKNKTIIRGMAGPLRI